VMGYEELAFQLRRDLKLRFNPVAFARVTEPPTNVPHFEGAVPSACTFWRRAEQGLFYADAEAHMGCPIGAMVMGFELSESKTEELMSIVGDMCAVAYLEESEVPQIPKFDVGVAGVVYGPLSKFKFNCHVEPDVVLVWVTPKGAMLLEENVGGTRWTSDNGGSILGRPACGALPRAHDSELPVLSLGCAGMRTFTEIPDEYVLMAIPRAQLEHIQASLNRTITANGKMTATYKSMKSSV
jgi:uncharacterized protein (DUF169 family)